jgi:NAD(P)-dependent dehydrogenase (short-subunit alcohol dehydrogenase family)
VFGLDLRDIALLERFCEFIARFYAAIHIIINNACQTVRRPPAYYAPLVEHEMMRWESMGEDMQAMLQPYRLFLAAVDALHSPIAEGGPKSAAEVVPEEVLEPSSSSASSSASSAASSTAASSAAWSSASASLFPSTLPLPSVLKASCVPNSAQASQAVVIAGDDAHNPMLFPKGATDVNGQQVDLRRENSWMLRLHQVSTDEMAEVLTINTMAPAVINARLKACMERNPQAWKFIVNVSAMEGKFYRYKSKNHPHTNMAKAALNMMTRTSAQDYVTSLIYMTAVDTGWINDEKPVELAVQHELRHNFQTPIDEVDAASRVLDPIISPLLQRQQGVAGVVPPWGVFLKDYQKCEW